MITTKSKRPTSKEIEALGPEPADLAGFQLLCDSEIKLGDLIVFSRDRFEWAFGYVGQKTDSEGCAAPPHGVRVYRRGNPPRHDGQTVTPGAKHYSDPGPRHAEPGARLFAACAHLPVNAADRKGIPIASGFVDYFPDAMAEVARVSLAGNRQHHPGKPLHWDKSKSTDEGDALLRHFLDRGTRDTDGQRHSAKVAWRAMALLQREIDAEKAAK